MNDNLDEMYREIILDHYRAPRGRKPLDKPDVKSTGHNPSCGDDVVLELEMDNNKVKDIHIECKGCAISVASSSMLAEYIKGKPLEEVKKLSVTVKEMLKGEVAEADLPDDIGDLDSLKGVKKFPVRIKCALLAWMTLIEGLKSYEKGDTKSFDISTEDDDKKE